MERNKRNNLVLTGPRGCGKTTVFRSLSLRHRYYTTDDKPQFVDYVGIYYRCDDLYFSFPRYEVPLRADAINLPMHFLCATLLRELLDVISLWLARHFPAVLKEAESRLVAALSEALLGVTPTRPGAANLEGLARELDRQRRRAADKQRFANDAKQAFGVYWGPEVVPRACAILVEHFDVLRERPVVFLVDDYSMPKITRPLQLNLNRLLMHRSALCFFKVATESPASFEASDIDGKAYVEGREFRLVNLGMDFINAERDDKMRFVDDVFERRFRYTQEPYPVTSLRELIGDEDPEASQNEIARKIREKEKPKIWGRKALGELCSGDVHFLIGLVGRMVAAAGGKEQLSPQAVQPVVTPDLQNKTIREEAGRFLKSIRSLPNGATLVEIVEAFGKVAASYVRHKDSKNDDTSPPHQASRIEPYDDPRLEGQAKQIYDDLLRYSVFIEDVRGKSRRGNVVPRLYLRRFLIPFFNLTFSKRDSLELTVDEFRELLLTPKEFENRKRLRAPEEGPQPSEAPQPLEDDGQGKLF